MNHTPSALRFILVGGFLGAGKTTTIARLARHYQARGQRVGIVTNDQAADLVDTNNLRAQGFEVGEVPGACFCCHFRELTAVVSQLQASARPDVVLAEPVGSCTDLAATVIRPLQQLYATAFDVAPYAVLLKPHHAGRILGGPQAGRGGFSPEAAYIFKKQLEEADVIVLNRIDEWPADRVDALEQLVRAHYPDVPVLRMSAKTGAGFEALVELLEQRGRFGQRLMDVDYDTYAAGEAELGWLNARLHVQAEAPWPLDEALLAIVAALAQQLEANDAEVAHLKAIGMGEGAYAVANLVSRDAPAELSLPSSATLRSAQLVINARVAIEPAALEALVAQAVETICRRYSATFRWQQVHSLRPGRPVPTHRILAPTT
jgi:G3E family GTPase